MTTMANELWLKWVGKGQEVLKYIVDTQSSSILKASELIAQSIASDHVCFLFGSGHAAIPVMEMFPRYGTILGFMPIVDQPLVSFLRMVGDMGYPQFDFIENSPEYGRRILENYTVHKEDTALLFSHSGTTPITVEVALGLKERGARVIAVTSLSHSKNAKPRHPSGLRLFEVADLVIDTGVPPGDVSITVSYNNRVIRAGPLSTFAFTAIANALVLNVIERLMDLGMAIETFPVRGFDPDADERMGRLLRRYRELYSRHLAR